MVTYYSGLVRKYGNLTARYKNAICLVLDENHIYEAIDIKSGCYYYDLPEERLEQVAVEDGFIKFFGRVLKESGNG